MGYIRGILSSATYRIKSPVVFSDTAGRIALLNPRERIARSLLKEFIMSAGRILAATLVGGIVMFAWGAVEHMATPLGDMGMSMIPNEGPLLVQMKQAVPSQGLYFFPGRDMKDKSEAAEKDWMNRMKKGPSGLLLITPENGKAMETSQLIMEFLTNILAAFILALIVSWRPMSMKMAGLVGACVGLYGWVSISASYWNWFGFPADFSLAALVEQVVGGLLSGVAIAMTLGKRRTQPAY